MTCFVTLETVELDATVRTRIQPLDKVREVLVNAAQIAWIEPLQGNEETHVSVGMADARVFIVVCEGGAPALQALLADPEVGPDGEPQVPRGLFSFFRRSSLSAGESAKAPPAKTSGKPRLKGKKR